MKQAKWIFQAIISTNVTNFLMNFWLKFINLTSVSFSCWINVENVIASQGCCYNVPTSKKENDKKNRKDKSYKRQKELNVLENNAFKCCCVLFQQILEFLIA